MDRDEEGMDVDPQSDGGGCQASIPTRQRLHAGLVCWLKRAKRPRGGRNTLFD